MGSNLSHWIKIQQLSAFSFLGLARGKNRATGAMSVGGEGAQTWATEWETPQRFFLCGLEGKGVSFYSLSAEETIHRELAAVAWRSRSLTASHDLTHASLAPRSSPNALPWSPKALPWSPKASPWFNCYGRRWIDLARSFCSALGFGSCGSKFKGNRLLFIGLSALARRGCEVLPFLSLNQTQTWLWWKDLERGKKSSSFRYGNPDSRPG
jgi:hypothetical protein